MDEKENKAKYQIVLKIFSIYSIISVIFTTITLFYIAYKFLLIPIIDFLAATLK